MLSLLMILYILGCGVYLWIRYRETPLDWLLRWVIVSAFPVVGWLFPLFWPGKWIHRERSVEILEQMNAEEFDAPRLNFQVKPNAAEELDVLAVEEALLVNQFADRRKVMINVLKQDAIQYIEILKKAVSNEDTETSHYAVSAVLEIKRKLLLSMQDLSVQYEANRQDAEVLKSYVEVLKQYMASGFLDDRTLKSSKFTYINLLGELIAVAPESEFAYLEKIDAELELGLLRDAESTANDYLHKCPESEDAYIGLMKVYFTMKSRDKVQSTLELLKQSPISLSSRALTLVRFWSGGT